MALDSGDWQSLPISGGHRQELASVAGVKNRHSMPLRGGRRQSMAGVARLKNRFPEIGERCRREESSASL
jgi:hypothetical protein